MSVCRDALARHAVTDPPQPRDGCDRLMSFPYIFYWPSAFSFVSLPVFRRWRWIYLPGVAVPSVAVDLPLADGAHGQAVVPPQPLVALDDAVPALARHGRVAQALHIQPAENPGEKHQEADAEAPTVRAVEMSCIPLLMECSSSEVQGATETRNNDATSRFVVPLSHGNESKESKSVQRKRVLPSWMLERDLVVQRVSRPVMTGGSRKKKGQGRGEGNIESLKSEVHVQQKKRLASEETTEDFEGGEQDQGKRSCLSIPVPSSQNTSRFPLETTMRDMEGSGKIGTKNPGDSLEKKDRQLHSKRVGQISSKDNRIEETENKEHVAGSTSRQAHWDRTSQYLGAQEGILEPDANLDCSTEISDSARSADASESSKQVQHKRIPCKYGSGCYRKNPIHFQQFSHPNDDDYHDMGIVAQGDDDSRPECPYGTACYRKNPQHKLEYKHSAPPAGRGTRQRASSNGKRAVKKDSVNDGEANDCDLNDHFTDEEEEEECEATDEDSDWEPSSEEKDNEDVDTRVQETRRFVRIKK
ncbi:aprataxin and PNK-like factor isoform X2 [Passer domesticus]|uniref:aprataxin and PNK-like factor isoform X2 n=1 Tax=Passer domesticus TaxID=48849 RepID=UPI0030FEC08C